MLTWLTIVGSADVESGVTGASPVVGSIWGSRYTWIASRLVGSTPAIPPIFQVKQRGGGS